MTYIDMQEEEETSRENDKLVSLKVVKVFKSISEQFSIVLNELKKNIKASHEASIPLSILKQNFHPNQQGRKLLTYVANLYV